MAELVIAALTTAAVTYAISAFAKLRSRRAFRDFRAGLAATTLVRRSLAGLVASALAGAETAVAGLCATALAIAFMSRPGEPAGTALAGTVLTSAALAGAALASAVALTAVLTAGVAVAVRRGVTAPCACFGSRGRAPLSGVHLTRNACLLAALAAGAGGTAFGHWPPTLAVAALAAAAGGVSALLITHLDDLTTLFGTAER